MNACCLFCETQKCAIIAHIIERYWGIRCISPQIIQRKWVKGKAEDKPHAMLPGYIFLYPEGPIERPLRIPGILRRLGDEEGFLQNEDLAFATMLEDHNGVLGTIRLAEEGDRCTVTDPLWEKMEGKVIKVDRSRKRCCVEFTFDSIRRTVWLGYELIQPTVPEETEKT